MILWGYAVDDAARRLAILAENRLAPTPRRVRSRGARCARRELGDDQLSE
jgi:hypothetical protein